MLKASAALSAALAVACGGGGKQAPTTTTTTPEPASTSTTPAESGSTAPEGASREKVRLVTPEQLEWKPAGTAQVAQVWDNGFFLKLPPGDKGTSHKPAHAIAVSGGAQGTYWYSDQTNACTGSEPCLRFFQHGDGAEGEKRIADITWTPFDPKNPKGGAWAQLWGDNKTGPSGMLFKLPPNNAPFWHFHKAHYHAVVLQGTPQHYQSGSAGQDLAVGTYWWQPGGYKHVDLCKGTVDCIIYAYYEGPFDVVAQ